MPWRLRFRSGAIGFVALILPWLLLPEHGRSQQIDAVYVSASSRNPEFPEANGGAIEGSFEVGDGWDLRFGLQRIGADTEKDALVCGNYQPPVSCRTEETRNEVSLTGFRAGVARSLLDTSHVGVELGAGFSFNQLGVESIGLVSGRDGDVYQPGGGQVGALGVVTVDVTPAPRVGLAVTLGVAAHWVNFDACSEFRYDPFCSAATFREVQVGVAYALPR